MFFAFENTVILQHFQFSLLSVLLLNLLDDVIIVVVLFGLGLIFESCLSDSKSWFFDDKIGVFLFLLYHSCGDVTVDQVVAAHCRRILILFYKFSLYF
jgi:hypothetical protein